jgi:enoyl-CoA hydratase/carnithine racemase
MTERQHAKISKDDRVAILTVDNPPVNMLTFAVVTDLEGALEELWADDEVKAIVITGAGQMVFIAGADINAILQLNTPAEAKDVVMRVHDLFQRIENSVKPIIAAVNGHALGAGIELAMACHMRQQQSHDRAARNRPGHNPWFWRHPAACPSGRQRQGS